ncbi:disulfide bond formation protein DsbC, partial [Cronobacter dublinensis subsp. dublinensis]|nr:disulfide bond formation protein DsbC [Cronobacter dublinensis subsp. dublinensis]
MLQGAQKATLLLRFFVRNNNNLISLSQ